MRTGNVVLATLCSALLLVACGQETAEQPEPVTADVGVTTEFEWVSQGTPAGQSTVVRTGDGKVTVESFVHWNNREYSVNSVTQLNADGYPVAQRITGISPFQAPIDESFEYKNGVATWSTAGESGSVTTDEPRLPITKGCPLPRNTLSAPSS